MNEQDKEYLSSLKFIETENYIDRKFYRPLGFKIANAIKHTGITPNTVTIISIFVGIAGACMFYFTGNVGFTFLGILGMVCANILDCVDGQLARMTGIKSEIGRILDGIAGDLWFLTIYTALALRIYDNIGSMWIFIIAGLSVASHFTQAALTDYYKTLHLYFVSPEKGKEFDTPASVRSKLKTLPVGINKLFTILYLYYTTLQSKLTPNLGVMIQKIDEKYSANSIPQHIRLKYRQGSIIVMKCLDLLTFNGRSIPLFIILITGHVWFYFLYEIVFLNIILIVSKNQHETLCRYISEEIDKTQSN
ncbi:CDP-alcohol phosphatidyltransferase family protein [Porphyromonas sp.]|uniref:CDP-alcohol phosphatidyltransferase family protein n=1 Tax=Porphyromonas sp. TaxID=1924944 RepID=UPI0026DC16E3|nr:CDP-alcohol phosphatidyltransferase family protein [Porphyromonas sp.]MDO4695214.1 CDP-alcohol phosphatidyltransferase family protein [Porphyromonas sp.]MDO4770986.1 CDP-alcohol phosphatidyltransferase family protein [Porphyromonas sp.]